MMTGLAVHKGQTEGQNKGNANIYVDEKHYSNQHQKFYHISKVQIEKKESSQEELIFGPKN